jgi:hypothetical protein
MQENNFAKILEKIKIIMSHNYKNNQNTKVAKNI